MRFALLQLDLVGYNIPEKWIHDMGKVADMFEITTITKVVLEHFLKNVRANNVWDLMGT